MAYVQSLGGRFFFDHTNRKIKSSFPNLYKGATARALKAGVEALNAKHGNYLTLAALAESGIFNEPDKTPLESAARVNLWAAWKYLDATAARDAVSNEMTKQ